MTESQGKIVSGKGATDSLSESQELLLMRHMDGELGLIGSWRARRLLRSRAAQDFCRELGAISKQSVLFEREASLAVDSLDLWSRIERRINEEEYTELLLGKRSGSANAPKRIVWPQAPVWRYGSVAAVACVMLLAVFSGDTPNPSTAPVSVANSAPKSWQSLVPRAIERTGGDSVPSAEFVAMSNSQRRVGRMMEKRSQRRSNVEISPSDIARMIAEDATPFEVDWMRSDGRLSLIQSAPREPAIIWVKRNQPSGSSTPRVIDRDFVAPQTVPAFK